MFKHLKLSYPPILIDVILDGLGKINVVCGKNNSGKSTLLESIKDEAKRIMGKRLGKEEIGFIFESSADAEQWRGFSKQRLRDVYRTLLEGVGTERKVWYENEKRPFVDKVADRVKGEPHLSEWNFPDARLFGAFERLFEDSLKEIMLPPKRKLALQSKIDTNQKPSADGTGVLNYLFYAANKYGGHNSRELFEKIRDAFGKITDGYSFHISAEEENKIRLSFSNKDKPWIYAESCGLGLQDLLIILVFAILPDYQVVLIEEPESHLHPDMQRKLLSFLRGETDKQYFISTHSNIFLDNAFIDRVFFTSFDERIHVRDETSKASILDDLGYSVTENLVSDLIILVEGPYDIPVIKEFLIKLGLYDSFNIKIWPLGGDIMGQLDLSIFAQGYSIVALVDNDPGSEAQRRKFLNNCGAHGIPARRLQRYAIENYFTLRALREVFSVQVPPEITALDPDIKLEDQIGMDIKKANRRVAKAMRLDEVKDTDFMDFLIMVKAKCESIKTS